MDEQKWIYQSGKIITHDQHGDPEVLLSNHTHIDANQARRIVEEHNELLGIKDVDKFMIAAEGSLLAINALAQTGDVKNIEKINEIALKGLELFPKPAEGEPRYDHNEVVKSLDDKGILKQEDL